MLITVASQIKSLREACHITQAQLAKDLDVTRSSVNAWEMGLTMPSLSKLVELAQYFNVSTDYLIGLDTAKALYLDKLTPQEQNILYELAQYFREIHS